jgi:tetratricopeptide (TPR) repeat protein
MAELPEMEARLASWTSNLEMMRGAIARHRSVLEQLGREELPLEWARAQLGLLKLFRSLSDHTGEVEAAQAAVEAGRAAAELLDPQRTPLLWFETQLWLAMALYGLGNLQQKTELMRESAAVFRESLERCDSGVPAHRRALFRRSQAFVLHVLGCRLEGLEAIAVLEEAVQSGEAALPQLTLESDSRMWAAVRSQLGLTQCVLAERRQDPAQAERGTALCREVLDVLTAQVDPFERAICELNLGQALSCLARLTRIRKVVEEALHFIRKALEVFDAENHERTWKEFQVDIGNLNALLEPEQPS